MGGRKSIYIACAKVLTDAAKSKEKIYKAKGKIASGCANTQSKRRPEEDLFGVNSGEGFNMNLWDAKLRMTHDLQIKLRR